MSDLQQKRRSPQHLAVVHPNPYLPASLRAAPSHVSSTCARSPLWAKQFGSPCANRCAPTLGLRHVRPDHSSPTCVAQRTCTKHVHGACAYQIDGANCTKCRDTTASCTSLPPATAPNNGTLLTGIPYPGNSIALLRNHHASLNVSVPPYPPVVLNDLRLSSPRENAATPGSGTRSPGVHNGSLPHVA